VPGSNFAIVSTASWKGNGRWRDKDSKSIRRQLTGFLIGTAMTDASIGFGGIIMITIGAHADRTSL
jgi:hypothetical protein